MNELETLKSIRRAVEQGNLEAVAALIGHDKTKMAMQTVFGSWLHLAAANGQLSVVKWLLDAGIDIDNRSGMANGTALAEAAEGGHLAVAGYLIERGAKLDVSEPEGNPLFAAIQEGSIEIVKLLLEAGIDASVKYSGAHMNNMGAYEFAIEQGQGEIATYIKDWLNKHDA